jgi:hypothetical protein
MSQSAIDDITYRGYDYPRNVQFSVFLENRCGKLLELVEIFDHQPINVVGLSIMDAADHAVVRMVTSSSDSARSLLRRNKFSFNEADILVVELDNTHSLTYLCTSLLSAEVNIHYAYPLLAVRDRHASMIALRTDDYILAGQILRRKLFTLLGEADLQEPGTASDTSAM